MRTWFLIILPSILFLNGCANTPAPALPTVVLDTHTVPVISSTGGMTASGVVMPAQEARVEMAAEGLIAKVDVTLGQHVEAGQILVELDSAAAQREYNLAKRQVDGLTSPLAIAQAELDLANAKQAFSDAETNYNNYVLDYQKGALLDAKDTLEKTNERYQYLLLHHENNVSGLMQVQEAYHEYIRALQVVQEAESAYETRHAAGLTASRATVEIITGEYAVAKAVLAEAQDYLAVLKGGKIPDNAGGEKLALLANARDRLTAAQTSLDDTRLKAPISGNVTSLDIVSGENVAPGQLLLVIHDVTKLHVETTDMSERDISGVKEGQAVMVLLKALNERVAGRVQTIAPLAETLGGDVVYRVTIDLDKQPDLLRAGMTVDVVFGVGGE